MGAAFPLEGAALIGTSRAVALQIVFAFRGDDPAIALPDGEPALGPLIAATLGRWLQVPLTFPGTITSRVATELIDELLPPALKEQRAQGVPVRAFGVAMTVELPHCDPALPKGAYNNDLLGMISLDLAAVANVHSYGAAEIAWPDHEASKLRIAALQRAEVERRALRPDPPQEEENEFFQRKADQIGEAIREAKTKAARFESGGELIP